MLYRVINVLLPLVIVGGISGCTVIKPTFEQSNQFVIEKTMNDIGVGALVKKQIAPSNTLVVRSIERSITVDEPIVAMVEDQMIASLYAQGFKVLERDAHTIGHLVRESDKTLLVEEPYTVATQNVKVEDLKFTQKESLLVPKHLYTQSKLDSADFILSYRVLEAGIKYNSLDDGFQWADLGELRWWFPWAYPQEVERETMMRLMVRLQNAKSGQIVYADILEHKNSDIIESGVADKLKTYHYTFYGHAQPLQKRSGLFSGLFE
ncbi:MAG: hypothetical protein KU28_01660 [Sulfurovum sp. PC08-66]|nr:MAG: hypothetical protein KU28_01660 [Sulfurovum sp. PC08-66]KIM12643.1 MAG: hypothetical protein KU37_01765 [Sulfuricurvum sp. PC08-66]